MTRQTNSSYDSSTISSTSSSSSSSSAGYASIKSISSWPSRISLQIKSSEFWNQFDRKSRKRKSVSSVLKNIFSNKQRGEPEKEKSRITDVYELQDLDSPSTSLIISHPSHHSLSPCPAGLYCVIDDFLTEYDTRMLEEEERAELLARRSRQIWEQRTPIQLKIVLLINVEFIKVIFC